MGVSRYDKFRHITTEILGRTYTPEDERRLGERFSELVVDEVVTCPFVPGARALLSGWPRSCRCSWRRPPRRRRSADDRLAAGPRRRFAGRLRHAVDQRGDPAADPCREGTSTAGEVVMVGDARSDLKGAREAGVRFVGRVPDGDARSVRGGVTCRS